MKIISFFRVIKFSLKNFWRNIWLTIATTLVMILTLFTISSLIILSMLGSTALNSLKEKVDISVYLNPDAKDEEVDEIRNNLISMPEVRTIDYISKEQALELFKEKHSDDDLIISSVDELEKNPLQPSLVVKARYPEDYSIISDFLGQDNYKKYIDKITFEDNRTIIDKIGNTTNMVERVGVIISIVFGVITVIFMFNTIRLTIYAQKDEIKIMRLIGAKNLFIRMPFILESILYALIASVISSAMLYFLLRYSAPYITRFIGDLQLDVVSFTDNRIFYLFILQIGLGVGLSIVSSYIALRKYLKT